MWVWCEGGDDGGGGEDGGEGDGDAGDSGKGAGGAADVPGAVIITIIITVVTDAAV